MIPTRPASDYMLSVRMPVDLLEAFRKVAESEERTVSQEIRRLMRLRISEIARSNPSAAR